MTAQQLKDEKELQEWLEANLDQDLLMLLLEDVMLTWGPDADSRYDLYTQMYLSYERGCAR